jgi:ATP-dependent DNA helicase RecQ
MNTIALSAMKKTNEILKYHFGFDSFRGLQSDIVSHVLQRKDCLVLMPTGGGKSICYQVPALAKEGITLVISPLISLMKDQVDALLANGINAAFLNSTLTYEQEKEVMNRCYHGQVKLLYMSPEKALGQLDHFLAQLPISLIAIDEAHCVSQWGHDFRPEYKNMVKLREKFTDTTMMALTATADKITRKDILELLGLRNPEVFVASFDRPNLSLSVHTGLKKKDKIKEIIKVIGRHPAESGIIYCQSRDACEVLAHELKNLGINAAFYHAGMETNDRIKVQDDFLKDNVHVVCATIAFGMGIDKSNVRFVIHYNLPKSLEGYYQEIGRGGRDGLPCETVMFYNLSDLITLRNFAEKSGTPQINIEKLNRMQAFAEAQHCRRRILLSYFGQHETQNCGNCDICLHPPKKMDGTMIAQKAISAVLRAKANHTTMGVNLLIDVLRGAKHKEIFARQLNTIKTYGSGAELSYHAWSHYIMQLVQLGALEIIYNEGNILQVSTLGHMVVKGEFEMPLHEFEKARPPFASDTKLHAARRPSINSASLFQALRIIRKQIAEELQVPPYVVLHDTALHDMVEKLPQTQEELLEVQGMSDVKVNKYGARFLDEIINYACTNEVAQSDVKKSVNNILSDVSLQAYYDELKTKNLRFSTTVVAKLLTGSTIKSSAYIAANVTFVGLLAGKLTYNAVKTHIAAYYSPIERKLKEEARKATLNNIVHFVRTHEYFATQPIAALSDDWIKCIKHALIQIPLQKDASNISAYVAELRKKYPRSHEPWSDDEISLLKDVTESCNDLQQITYLFGRTENSIVAMSSKWLEGKGLE